MTSKHAGSDGSGSQDGDDGGRRSEVDDEPVPRLPRSLGFKLSTAAIVRILMTAALLAMLLVAQRPCADSVSEFVTDFDKVGGSGASTRGPGDQMPKPGRIDTAPTVETGSAGDYETLRADMTEAQLKAAIDRAKVRAAGGSNATGSNAATGSGSNAATGSGLNAATGSGSNAATGSGSNAAVGSNATGSGLDGAEGSKAGRSKVTTGSGTP